MLSNRAAILAIVVTGVEMELVTHGTADATILVIFASCLIGPLIVGAAIRRIEGSDESEENSAASST